MPDRLIARRWDDEYRGGRYADDPPVAFVHTVLDLLRARPGGAGLYVGCGNGRNFIPLLDAGLDLYGLDVSGEALRQLAERRPEHAARLLQADFRHFEPAAPFDYLVAIQVFQHGARADVATYFDRARAVLGPGGLLFLRVNSAETEVHHRHEVIERGDPDGFTVRYLDGPKRGLAVHFYGRRELDALTTGAFRCVREPHEDVARRTPPRTGVWAQWEAVYERQ